MGEDFEWVAIDLQSLIPVGEKVVRNRNEVSGLATASALLSKWAASVHGVIQADVNVNVL